MTVSTWATTSTTGSPTRPCSSSVCWRASWPSWRSRFRSWGADMNLGQALLDQQVVDRSGELMGKVDGIVLEMRDGKAPRVACLMIGGGTAARRIRPGFAEWLLRWRRRWGPTDDRALEVPWAKVRSIGID